MIRTFKYTGTGAGLDSCQYYYFEGKSWLLNIYQQDVLHSGDFHGIIESMSSSRKFYFNYSNTNCLIFGFDKLEGNSLGKGYYSDNLPIPDYLLALMNALYYQYKLDNRFLEDLKISHEVKISSKEVMLCL